MDVKITVYPNCTIRPPVTVAANRDELAIAIGYATESIGGPRITLDPVRPVRRSHDVAPTHRDKLALPVGYAGGIPDYWDRQLLLHPVGSVGRYLNSPIAYRNELPIAKSDGQGRLAGALLPRPVYAIR